MVDIQQLPKVLLTLYKHIVLVLEDNKYYTRVRTGKKMVMVGGRRLLQ